MQPSAECAVHFKKLETYVMLNVDNENMLMKKYTYHYLWFGLVWPKF